MRVTLAVFQYGTKAIGLAGCGDNNSGANRKHAAQIDEKVSLLALNENRDRILIEASKEVRSVPYFRDRLFALPI